MRIPFAKIARANAIVTDVASNDVTPLSSGAPVGV